MDTIYDLIEKISVRTAMYTGECKLSNVRSFIDGYTLSIQDQEELKIFCSDFSGFHDWVAKKYGFYESTAGWQNMILAVELGLTPHNIHWEGYSSGATDEQHKSSVATFFQLVSEYGHA